MACRSAVWSCKSCVPRCQGGRATTRAVLNVTCATIVEAPMSCLQASRNLGVPPSWAQRPPTNDVSDTMANTGGGTSALINIKTGNANTAYGNLALETNSTGTGNTAMPLLCHVPI